MDDFTFDVVQKKRIAQGARYRKRGSKSKRCSLSTDYMTQKQWKERNGEIMSYQFSKPMVWKEFKSMPIHIQSEYLHSLIERFRVNATSLSEMLGVGTQTIKKHIEENGFGISFRVGNSMKASEREAWNEFLYGSAQPTEQVDSPKMPAELEDLPMFPAKPSAPMSLDEFSLFFSGKIDAAAITNSILHIAGAEAVGSIEIKCSLTQNRS
jgi:hypothetical protein